MAILSSLIRLRLIVDKIRCFHKVTPSQTSVVLNNLAKLIIGLTNWIVNVKRRSSFMKNRYERVLGFQLNRKGEHFLLNFRCQFTYKTQNRHPNRSTGP